jgi:hypothetical protein
MFSIDGTDGLNFIQYMIHNNQTFSISIDLDGARDSIAQDKSFNVKIIVNDKTGLTKRYQIEIQFLKKTTEKW